MFKLNIFKKSMLIVISLIIGYIFVLSVFILPSVNTNVQKIEEKNAKAMLMKVSNIAKNLTSNLEGVRKHSL